MDRREFIAGALASVAVPAFSASSDVAPDLVGHFSAQLRAHVAADTRLGALPLLHTVTTEHDVIMAAAPVASPALRTQMLRVAVGYADLAAWLHQDLGDLDAAEQWSTRTLRLAHRCDDTNLVAVALASGAYLQVDARNAAAAADLADAALRAADVPSRGYVLWQAAHAHAFANNPDRLDHVLDAIDTTSQPDEPTAWWWTGTGSTERLRATCYGRVGRHDQAANIWNVVLDHETGHRNRGGALARYATALFHTDGPDAALTPAAEAVDCYRRTGSARMHHKLTELRTLAATHDSPTGQHLHDLLLTV